MKKVYFEPATNVLNLGTQVMTDTISMVVASNAEGGAYLAPVRPASTLYI